MIKVGITERHGIAQEFVENPPRAVQYIGTNPDRSIVSRLIRSPAKGVLNFFSGAGFDYIEAPLFPIRTNSPWVYTPADTATAMAFNFLGLPTPRIFRELYLRALFERDNFKALLFKSKAGLETLNEYPNLASERVRKKSNVLYPAVRKFDEINRNDRSRVNIVFVGEFFRKGGMHVVNAFKKLHLEDNRIELTICADRNKHFNHPFKEQYLETIENHPAIKLLFVSRNELLGKILPSADIFISPTYRESFGYAILEAMALGLPIVSTNIFAIPEIVTHNETGLLIDIKDFAYIKNHSGYSVENIPKEFMTHMDNRVEDALRELVSNKDMRLEMGFAGRKVANDKFSFQNRNKILETIYR